MHPRTNILRFSGASAPRGFALITLLMLMSLLLLLAVGLLSLSSISLRNGGTAQAASVARANARLALQLAIGELQRETGPDQRITTTADQISAGGEGVESAALPTRKHWTGVYQAWTDEEELRPEPDFLRWLVSGEDDKLKDKEGATTPGSDPIIELVGHGSVDDLEDGRVEVPLVTCAGPSGGGRYGWWVADQGTKAAVATPNPDETADLAATRATLQSAPRYAAEVAATAAGEVPFADLPDKIVRTATLTGWKQAELLASTSDSPKPLFHDLAARSVGLLTDVRSGGFRKDLSLYLERPASKAPKEPLYMIDGEAGINMSELWVYYNLWRELETGASVAYTTGGSIAPDIARLQIAELRADMLKDPGYIYKQPSFVSIRTLLSFHAREVKVSGRIVKRLAVVADPIVTMWNPLDVPVVLSPAFNSVKFCQLPYDITIKRPSGDEKMSLCRILGGSDKGWQYMTLVVGKTLPVVLKPGEVLMFSQGANTEITSYKAGLNYINAEPGWNFGGGIAFDVKTVDGKYIETAGNETFTYEIEPNSITSYGSQDWLLTGHGLYYKGVSGSESYDIGGLAIDQIHGMPPERIRAAEHLDFFDKIKASDTRPLSFEQLVGRKEAFMRFSFDTKTEADSERPGRFLSRLNPKAFSIDIQSLDAQEAETLPVEVKIEAINDFRNIAVNATGQSYFGGGATAECGGNIVITHTIPREPPASLAAFQHALANGFHPISSPDSPPLLPQISHAIGNSAACPVIPADRTSSQLTGPRALADHSFLANQALWDSWFLSGVAPQTAPTFSQPREQEEVARDFLGGTRPLPNNRYRPFLHGETADEVLAGLFDTSGPKDDAHLAMASHLLADGLFNINSTSVEAWKCVLSGLKDKPVVTRDRSSGSESTDPTHGVPVPSLVSPEDEIAERGDLPDILSEPQWVGRRVLDDAEITALAEAIVREVRKRGPFLCLADFVNRRPGNDPALARCGAIQSALDSEDVPINDAYNSGPRSADIQGADRGYTFSQAEEGPAAYGIPGVVKQADILTPIAPYLSARSDTFVIRTYGDCLDAGGRVIARAWCEAEVRRQPVFLDPSDPPETALGGLKPVNQRFGRRYQLVSFRWLAENEV
ncbi:MAG: hypothetical protein H7A50_05745 [Akkermansiaceae bacterium]|nr:hypothetical protein [Akkermansiaceae bacterium]